MILLRFSTVLWLALSLAGYAQQPIRVDVHLINVAFSVRDSEGKLVTDLGPDDFEVLEDGAPQKISFFARSSDLPLNLGLVVDFSGSQEHSLKSHHSDVETFLKTVLTPRDRVFLLCFGNHLRLASDYTGSAKDLVESLRLFEKGNRDMPEIGPKEIRPSTTDTAFFDAVYYSVTEMLAPTEKGRRALVLFTDGDDNSSARNMMEAIEIAQTNNVVLYCVRYTETDHGRLTARNKNGIGVLDRMAADTGGGHFDAREKDLAASFRLIGEQLRSSYELAYHTTNPASDRTFRKIAIRPRTSGLTVRAKAGYYAR